jgi:hypothetical protein
MANGIMIEIKPSNEETLKYAGVCFVREERDYTTGKMERWVKIYTPRGVDFKIWAEQQIGRMARLYGFEEVENIKVEEETK